MLRLNKSAESVMIGYVVLIAIAIALSTGVFIYLKLYLPSDKPECYQDIDLVIDSATCTVGQGISNVNIEFTNKGLFSIDSAYIKIGDADRIFRTTLNDPDADRMSSSCNNLGSDINLKPGAKFCKTYVYSSAPTEIQEISVEPLLWIENIPVLCPEAIVRKKINCV